MPRKLPTRQRAHNACQVLETNDPKAASRGAVRAGHALDREGRRTKRVEKEYATHFKKTRRYLTIFNTPL